MKLNNFLFNIMPNGWINQEYVHVFYCQSINFNKEVNIFEGIDILESIYEGILETSQGETSKADSTRAGHVRLKRGESALSNTYSEMSESAEKLRKRYVD